MGVQEYIQAAKLPAAKRGRPGKRKPPVIIPVYIGEGNNPEAVAMAKAYRQACRKLRISQAKVIRQLMADIIRQAE